MLSEVEPTAILHAAALTNVDLCEENPARADAINRGSTQTLADYANAQNVRLVVVSTDSVFDGARGNYAETDVPAPLNEYARSKLRAEQAAASIEDHLVARTNLFARSTRGVGLAEWILRELSAGHSITGFSDVIFSPLYCRELATRLIELVVGTQRGLLHLGSTDAVSKLEFAQLIADAYGLDAGLVKPGLLSDVPMKAPRPANTSLNTSLASSVFAKSLPTVRESIEQMATDRLLDAA
jgi:dTDP-4-dehydrorhamnose reductase